MKVYKCNICGVEFYEGHEICPFCNEPASNATYVGTKEERIGSADLYQSEPCDEDISKCDYGHEEDVIETVRVAQYSPESESGASKTYVGQANVGEARLTIERTAENSTPPKQVVYVQPDRHTAKSSTAGIPLILGIISIFFGFICSIINLVIYNNLDKSQWSDSERKTAKLGVSISVMVLVFYLLFVGFFVIIFILGTM